MLPCWVSGVGVCCLKGRVCGLMFWQRGMVWLWAAEEGRKKRF